MLVRRREGVRVERPAVSYSTCLRRYLLHALMVICEIAERTCDLQMQTACAR